MITSLTKAEDFLTTQQLQALTDELQSWSHLDGINFELEAEKLPGGRPELTYGGDFELRIYEAGHLLDNVNLTNYAQIRGW